jgi:hypothetical protein
MLKPSDLILTASPDTYIQWRANQPDIKEYNRLAGIWTEENGIFLKMLFVQFAADTKIKGTEDQFVMFTYMMYTVTAYNEDVKVKKEIEEMTLQK